MSGALLQYTTREGDRWDLIAHKYYGNALLLDGLIAANPHLPIAEAFGAGLTVTEIGAAPVAKGEPVTSVRTPVPVAMV